MFLFFNLDCLQYLRLQNCLLSSKDYFRLKLVHNFLLQAISKEDYNHRLFFHTINHKFMKYTQQKILLINFFQFFLNNLE